MFEIKKLFIENVDVYVINNVSDCILYINKLLSYNCHYIGIDAEWKPKKSKLDKNNKISVFQISNHKICLIIQIQQLKYIPKELISLLSNVNILKCGVNIHGDAKKFSKDYGFSIHGIVDINNILLKCNFYNDDKFVKNNNGSTYGLKQLSYNILNFITTKDMNITLSNWENKILTNKQIKYAAYDAIISFYLFNNIIKFYNKIMNNLLILKIIIRKS